MKRFILLAAGVLSCAVMNGQSMKMVVDNKGEVVGRYVRTNAKTYTVSVQDDYEVPKAGNRVVTFSAAAGQGIIYRRGDRHGNINVRQKPTTKSIVVGKLIENEGIPDVYDCLGKVGEWYKIRIDDKIGYVREDMVYWDGMDSLL